MIAFILRIRSDQAAIRFLVRDRIRNPLLEESPPQGRNLRRGWSPLVAVDGPSFNSDKPEFGLSQQLRLHF